MSLSDQQLGWLGSAYVIVLSFAALPLGVVGDLKSRRSVIGFAVAVWGTFTTLGGVVRRYWQLFLCRSMVGVGEAGYSPAAQALIAEYFPGPRRALAIGVYSVGMACGGVLGIWAGGELALRYGWRTAFVVIGLPAFLLALLASRLREPHHRAPAPLLGSLLRSVSHGARSALHYAAPGVAVTLLGALVSGALILAEGSVSESATAIFATFAVIGIGWVVLRLIPLAVRRTTQATEVAATALGDFQEAAATVLATPTLVWVFVGGAMVTFAVNGLVVWAPSFMERVHGMSVAEVGRQFAILALAGGVLGVLAGGLLGDLLSARWKGGRVIAAGSGFVLGAPVCVALLLVRSIHTFAPLLFGTFFFYMWYNGPLPALILDVVPSAVRASVLGAFVLFSHLAGDAIAPPLVGYLSDRAGIGAAVLLLPAVGLVGGLVLLVALRTVARDMKRAGK